jgi:hypothetical protein
MIEKSSKYETERRKELVIEAAKTAPSFRKACDIAGVPSSTANRWRRDDEDFAEALHEAEKERWDVLREHIYERAIGGYEKPVYYKGRPLWRRDPKTNELLLDENFEPIPLTETVVSDRLLERYLEANLPEFARKSSLELSGPNGGPVSTQLVVNFVDPPDWDKVKWDPETGRAELPTDK